MKMDIFIIEDRCIGCGNCVEVCPAVFYFDVKLGKSRIIDPEACEYVGCCEVALENCPVEAIVMKV